MTNTDARGSINKAGRSWWWSRVDDLLMVVAIVCLLVGYSGASNATSLEARTSQEMQETITLEQVGKGELLLKTNSAGSSADSAATGSPSTPNIQTYRPAALLDEDVTIDVSGLIVTVTLKQRFKNNTPDWLEAIYAFPLPENAALYGMNMRIGERIIKGEIEEKQKAKQRYNKAKNEGKKAALVEQHRPNLFTNNVANIPPGETVEVMLEYNQILDYQHGGFTLRFPMTTTPRYMPGKPLAHDALSTDSLAIDSTTGWAMPTDQVPDAHLISPYTVLQSVLPNGDHSLKLNVSVNAGFPVERFESISHAITVTPQGHAGQTIHDITLQQEQVAMDRDFVMSWKPVVGSAPKAALFSEVWEGDQYSLVMLMPPEQLSQQRVLPREMIFVVDTSGSMGGESIRQARRALENALSSLKSTDRFNIIEFNSATRTLFNDSVEVTPNTLHRARGFVQGLRAQGGTEISDALDAAFSGDGRSGYLRQVVFLTDGSVGNEVALFQQIRRDLGASRLFTVGIGSAPNSYFMRKAAEFGRGDFTYIGDISEIEDKLKGLFKKLKSPVLSDIVLQAGDGHSASSSVESYPPRIEDLYMGAPLVQVIKHEASVDPLMLAARNVNSDQKAEAGWRQSVSLTGGKSSKGIATYWARQKIEFLNDAKSMNGMTVAGTEEKTIRQQIVDVALKHHLVSPYTSLVAIEKTVTKPGGSELHQVPVAQLLPAGSQGNMVRFPQTGTSSQLYGLLGLICYALAIGMLYQCRPAVFARRRLS